jgi:hypothetical protein
MVNTNAEMGPTDIFVIANLKGSDPFPDHGQDAEKDTQKA